jgi:hypothetical protein
MKYTTAITAYGIAAYSMTKNAPNKAGYPNLVVAFDSNTHAKSTTNDIKNVKKSNMIKPPCHLA